jgi:hypothetical protein
MAIGGAFSSAFGLKKPASSVGSGLGSLFNPGVGKSVGSGVGIPFKPKNVASGVGKAQPSYTPPKAPVQQKARAVYKGPGNYSQPSGGGGSSGGGGWVDPGYGTPGSGGGGGEGGGGGGIDVAQMAAPAPVWEDIVIPDAKSDTDYQRTVTDLAKALSDFQAQQTLARNQYDTGWNDQKHRLGWNETTNAFDPSYGAYGDATSSNLNDFAGRGALKSSAFGEALANINRDFADRKTGLDTDRTNNVNTAAQALSAYQGQQASTTNLALQDAINRIASKYAVTLEQAATPQTIQRERIG